LEDPTSPAYAALVADSRRQLGETGAVEFPGFVTAAGVEALVADAEDLACRAHHSEGLGTPYLELPADGWPAEHPRQTWSRYAVGAVPYDAIPRSSPLRQLYEWEPLCDLVEAVVDRGPLHRYADPFGALNLAVMGEGEELQWHFDQTDFVVSVAIQTADSGGHFEVHPRIRTENDERYDDVAAVLAGSRAGCVTLPMTPGTLLVFEGRNSLHRVSPVGWAEMGGWPTSPAPPTAAPGAWGAMVERPVPVPVRRTRPAMAVWAVLGGPELPALWRVPPSRTEQWVASEA
jgi:hypothetical protein